MGQACVAPQITRTSRHRTWLLADAVAGADDPEILAACAGRFAGGVSEDTRRDGPDPGGLGRGIRASRSWRRYPLTTGRRVARRRSARTTPAYRIDAAVDTGLSGDPSDDVRHSERETRNGVEGRRGGR